MDFSAIATLISSVGFPIACCVYLIFMHSKERDKDNETLDKLRETVDNNTKAMIKLCERLGVDYDKD